MQFIRLPEEIGRAEMALPKLLTDWTNNNSVHIMNIRFLQKLDVNMKISWVIEG